MWHFKWAVMAPAFAFMAGCVTTSPSFAPPTDYVKREDIQIADHFSPTELNDTNAADAVLRCLPTIPRESAALTKVRADLPLKRGQTVTIGHSSSASRFVITGNKGLCIRYSDANFPIFATQAFVNTVEPAGISPDIRNDWYRQIAHKLALHGIVRVAYVFPNGNAFMARYWADKGGPTLVYSSTFHKAGRWEKDPVELKFTDPNLQSVSVIETNGRRHKVNLLE